MIVKGYLWFLSLGDHSLSGKTKGVMGKKDGPLRTEGRVCWKEGTACGMAQR